MTSSTPDECRGIDTTSAFRRSLKSTPYRNTCVYPSDTFRSSKGRMHETQTLRRYMTTDPAMEARRVSRPERRRCLPVSNMYQSKCGRCLALCRHPGVQLLCPLGQI